MHFKSFVNSNSYKEFIRWFHQSRIPNLRFFLTNICHDFFFNWCTEKKNCLGPIKSLFTFSTAHTEKKSWTKLVKQIGENIWWTQTQSRICASVSIFLVSQIVPNAQFLILHLNGFETIIIPFMFCIEGPVFKDYGPCFFSMVFWEKVKSRIEMIVANWKIIFY